MDYIQAAIRGDIEQVMDLSFDCLSCGMCAIRCPAEIVQYNVGLLGRRLYGKYLAKESKQLGDKLAKISRDDRQPGGGGGQGQHDPQDQARQGLGGLDGVGEAPAASPLAPAAAAGGTERPRAVAAGVGQLAGNTASIG